ncbi:MAG: hypothetical protein ACTSYB_11330 [Candidatus Helarchaeota archaeon]
MGEEGSEIEGAAGRRHAVLYRAERGNELHQERAEAKCERLLSRVAWRPCRAGSHPRVASRRCNRPLYD